MAPPLTLTRSRGNPRVLIHSQRLRRESFVQFNRADVVQAQARQFERFSNGERRTDSHLFRQTAGIGEGGQSRQRPDSHGAGPLAGHYHRGGGAVRCLRRIPGGHPVAGVEGGLGFA